jgi:hypothetical protein
MQTQNNLISSELIKATFFLPVNYLASRLSDKAPTNKLIQSDNLHSICFPTPPWPPSGHKSAVRTCNEGEGVTATLAGVDLEGVTVPGDASLVSTSFLACWRGGGGVSKEKPRSASPVGIQPQCPITPSTQGSKHQTYVVRGKSHQTSWYGKVRQCHPSA